MDWQDGNMGNVVVSSDKGGSTQLIFGSRKKNIKLKKGESKRIVWK
jgi:hypothetical protein